MYLILGMGQTGMSLAEYLFASHCPFVSLDTREDSARDQRLRQRYGEHCVAAWPQDDSACRKLLAQAANGVMLSPGVDPKQPQVAALLKQAAQMGVAVRGDLDLYFTLSTRPRVLVTGSNGKSTVAQWLTEALSALGYRVALGGNFGTPALDLLSQPADIDVLEVSSFQLETVHTISSLAAVWLNLSPDHLDRHADMVNYAQLKAKIFKHTACAVANADDAAIAPYMGAHMPMQTFSLTRTDTFAHIDTRDGKNWLVVAGQLILPVDELALPGRHNQANALAVLVMLAAVAGNRALQQPAVTAVLRGFTGLEHRMELVDEHCVDGVVCRYINDSKATNVGATQAAVAGMTSPFGVILGGVRKGQDFVALATTLRESKAVVGLIGEDQRPLADLLASAGVPVLACDAAEQLPELLADMTRRLVDLAQQAAVCEVTVLFSPACASFDWYNNYQSRGVAFKNSVVALDQLEVSA